ncbi:MAG: hypothetical protein N2171_01985 [Clostridia bacterium]|nr:hypothetical protein [Clostridia bacterium]
MKIFRLTFSAVICAISVILLYISAIIPSGKVAVFALATGMLCATVIECGEKFAFASFVVVGLLSFFMLPNKLILVPYAIFFGFYPILKLHIEKLNKIVLEWLIKLLSFSLAMLAAYFVVGLIVGQNMKVEVLPYFIPMALLGFAAYDYALSLFIGFYKSRISKYLKK